MKIKRLLCLLVCFSLLISANAFCTAAASGEYVQRVVPSKSMYTPKTIYVDDDFNDRTVENVVSETNYTKGIAGACSSAVAASEEGGNVYASSSASFYSGAYITLLNSNNIQSDKLALSFRYRPNSKAFFRLRFGTCPIMMFQHTTDTKGIIKVYSALKTAAFAYDVNYAFTEWINCNIIFEKIMTDGVYRPHIKQIYINDTALDMSKVEAILGGTQFYDDCPDWWSGDVASAAVNFDMFSAAGMDIDDIMLCEPYDFSALNASYDNAENTVRVVFAQGISETAADGVTLSENGTVLECAKAVGDDLRTVVLTPLQPLDLENNTYTVVVSNAYNYNNTDSTSASFVFGRKGLIAQSDGWWSDGYPAGRYFLPSQNVSGRVTLTNLTDEEKSVTALSAYYENGLLKAVGSMDKKTVPAGESLGMQSDITLPGNLTSGELKTFVLESNLRPVAKAFGKDVLNTTDVKLYLMGDSICDDSYSLDKYRRGWGGFIGDYFGDEVTVVNHGHSGYTIENFMNGSGWKTHNGADCSWENIKDELNAGDVVMLSLGINDNGKIEKGEYTWEYYQESIETIITGAREKGADVVLVTCTPNYYAYSSSKDSFSNNSYNTPREKMMETALKNGVACFDLNTALKSKLNDLLAKGWTVDNIFPAYTLDDNGNKVWTKNENGDYIAGLLYSDLTHYTREGSRLIAKLIADYLKSSRNDLISFIKEPEAPAEPEGNLLGDYSFEGSNAALRAVAGGSISYDSDVSRSGKQSVKFTKSGIWSGLGIGSSDTYLLDLIKENGAGRYHFEAYVKPGTYFVGNDFSADISLKFIGSDGVTVSPALFEVAPVTAPMRISQTERETKWQKVSVDFNIDDLSELDNIAKIQLYVSAGIGRGVYDATQSVWVDDAALYRYDRGARVVLMGDSVCTSSATTTVGQLGWGAFAGSRLNPAKAFVYNTAAGGNTLLSYTEGSTPGLNWADILAELKSGDYLFVSLGINDEIEINKSGSEYSWDLYKQNLTKIITEAREKGAEVLLITPTENAENAYNEETSRFDISAREAVSYMKEAAESTGTLCYDLNRSLMDEMNKMLASGKTKDEVIEYFHLVKSDGTVDATHLSTPGAIYVSNMIMDYVNSSESELKNLMANQ